MAIEPWSMYRERRASRAEMGERTESTFGDYMLHERIGVGGMAEAFVAARRGAAEYCVVKLIQDQESADANQRIRREAQTGVHLDHENVVRTLDAGTVSGTFFVAIELIHGVDLGRLAAAKAPLPVPIVVEVLDQALAGLAHAHAARGPDGAPLGLVHRDLSPSNLMVADDGCVKIIDFGLVRAELDDVRTRPGVVLGTLAYASPEQCVADPVDARSDLYALSAVAYELLTGMRAARGEDVASMVSSVLSHIPLPIRATRDDVPAELAAAIERGLSKRASDRHEDASAYRRAFASAPRSGREALGRFVSEAFPEIDLRRARWRIEDEPPRGSPTRTDVVPSGPSRRSSPRRSRRAGRGVVVAAGVAACVAGGAAWWAVSRSQEEPASAPPVRVEAPMVTPRAIAAPTEAPDVTEEAVSVRPRKRRARARPVKRVDVPAPQDPTPSDDLAARLERIDARARALDASQIRARVRFLRASGAPTAEAVAELERAIEDAERAPR